MAVTLRLWGVGKICSKKYLPAIPSTTLPLSVDISDCKTFERAFKEVIERFQQIDLAIICASIGDLNPSLEISQELDTLATNIVGWTNVIDTLYKVL